MGRRFAIAGLAVLGIVLIIVAIGSYKGWFDPANDSRRVSNQEPFSGGNEDPGGEDEHGRATGEQPSTPTLIGSGELDSIIAPGAIEYAIEGYVTTVDGGGIPGASIEVLENRSLLFAHEALRFLENVGRPDPPLVSGVGDSSGSFRVTVPGAGRYFLKASAAGYSSVVEGPIHVHQSEPVAALSLPLPVGYSISGIVTDGSGKPLGDVPMILMQKGNLGHSYYNHETSSGPDGMFAFDGLEAVGYVLMVPPLAEGEGTHGTLIPRLTAPTSGLEVRLEGGRRFHGRVVEAAKSSRPVVGAAVTLLNPIGYAQTKTDENGEFQVFLNGGDAEIVVEGDGFLLYESRVDLDSSPEVIELERGAILTGQLLFPSGRPAAEVELALMQSSRFLGSLRSTRTDPDGRFRFEGIDPSPEIYLLPRVDGYWIPFGSVSLSVDEQEVGLEPTSILTGTVVDSQEMPLDTVWVHLEPVGEGLASRAAYWLRGEAEGWSDDDGNFAFPDVLPGIAYVLRASTAGVADGSARIRGGAEDPVTLVLSPGATMDFTLVEEGGQSFPSGVVLIASWKGAPGVFRTPDGVLDGGKRFHADSLGHVIVDNVPEGAATFYFVCAGYVERRLELDVRAGEVYSQSVAMKVAGELIVTTVGRGGAPVPMTRVTVRSTRGGNSTVRRSGPLGVCAFPSLPPGSYTVSAAGFRPERVEITEDSLELNLESRNR